MFTIWFCLLYKLVIFFACSSKLNAFDQQYSSKLRVTYFVCLVSILCAFSLRNDFSVGSVNFPWVEGCFSVWAPHWEKDICLNRRGLSQIQVVGDTPMLFPCEGKPCLASILGVCTCWRNNWKAALGGTKFVNLLAFRYILSRLLIIGVLIDF